MKQFFGVLGKFKRESLNKTQHPHREDKQSLSSGTSEDDVSLEFWETYFKAQRSVPWPE